MELVIGGLLVLAGFGAAKLRMPKRKPETVRQMGEAVAEMSDVEVTNAVTLEHVHEFGKMRSDGIWRCFTCGTPAPDEKQHVRVK